MLLDTHVLIWLDSADPRLGVEARAAIEKAHQAGDLAVSARIKRSWTGMAPCNGRTLGDRYRANSPTTRPDAGNGTVPEKVPEDLRSLLVVEGGGR